MKRFALVAIASALFLTLCDQLFHVQTGTLVYHWDPQVAGQTILVPITFLLATIFMLGTSRRVHAVSPRPTSTSALLASLGVVTVAYSISGLVDQRLAPSYALVLLAAWVVRIARRGEGATVIVAGLVIAAGGVLGEAALSAIGEFSYAQPDLLGVPWWLFPLYLHGALAARDLVASASSQLLEGGDLQAAGRLEARVERAPRRLDRRGDDRCAASLEGSGHGLGVRDLERDPDAERIGPADALAPGLHGVDEPHLGRVGQLEGG